MEKWQQERSTESLRNEIISEEIIKKLFKSIWIIPLHEVWSLTEEWKGKI
jgi:hypothetical protein